MKAYMGIDVGKSGAAVVVAEDGTIKICRFMNATEKERWDFFNSISFDYECEAIMELVHSMPGEGVSSSWSFGRESGLVEAFLTASCIPYQKKTPQTWMKYFGIKREIVRENGKEVKEKSESKTEYKRRLRNKAEQLYPNIKMTNDISDAVLIAHFCKNTYK